MRRLLCLAALLAPCVYAAPTLVLVSDPWCPVACEASAAKPGYLVDIAKAVFEPAGYRIDYQVVPFARAEAMINSGEASVFLGVLKLPKRQNWVFPRSPQAVSRVCFYTRPDADWRYRDQQSLARLHLGTIRGYSYGKEMDAQIRVAQIDEVSGVDGLKRGVAKLNKGHIDALLEYELVAQYYQHQSQFQLRNAGCGRSSDDLYIAFSPHRADAPQLAKMLDDGMQQLRRSGKLKRILQSYGIDDWSKPN